MSKSSRTLVARVDVSLWTDAQIGSLCTAFGEAGAAGSHPCVTPEIIVGGEVVALPPPKDDVLRFDVDREQTFEARRMLPDGMSRLRVHAGQYARCSAAAVVIQHGILAPARLDVEAAVGATPIDGARNALDALELELLEAIVDIRRLRAAIEAEAERRLQIERCDDGFSGEDGETP